jgi:DNA-directed RNA polymerase specialized sigma24 family protein
MTTQTSTESGSATQGFWFTPTHWSVILSAQNTSSPNAGAALEKLCRTYWYPIYAYVRRQGEDVETAKDLTQGYFARLLEKRYLGQVHPDKGKFRSFLLASLKHFLADERDRKQAQKRGGDYKFVSLDDDAMEERYCLEAVDGMTAEKLFDRRWALALLEQAQTRLRQEYVRSGRSPLYEALKPFAMGSQEVASYAGVATNLGMTESAIKSAIFRIRQRYRELIRAEVANTVPSGSDVDAEIRHLIAVIGD